VNLGSSSGLRKELAGAGSRASISSKGTHDSKQTVSMHYLQTFWQYYPVPLLKTVTICGDKTKNVGTRTIPPVLA
jgi:hypothetical protein